MTMTDPNTQDVTDLATASRLAAMVFAETGWGWGIKLAIPDAAEIEETLRVLVSHLEPGGSINSGRFIVLDNPENNTRDVYLEMCSLPGCVAGKATQ